MNLIQTSKLYGEIFSKKQISSNIYSSSHGHQTTMSNTNNSINVIQMRAKSLHYLTNKSRDKNDIDKLTSKLDYFELDESSYLACIIHFPIQN